MPKKNKTRLAPRWLRRNLARVAAREAHIQFTTFWRGTSLGIKPGALKGYR